MLESFRYLGTQMPCPKVSVGTVISVALFTARTVILKRPDPTREGGCVAPMNVALRRFYC